MSASTADGSTDLIRLPGDYGPVVRLNGELTRTTANTLRREVELFNTLGHPILTLHLNGRFIDAEGVLALIDTVRLLRANHKRLVLVAGTDQLARMLRMLGVDDIVPVFPTEEIAALALRGGGPPAPAPPTWKAAGAEALAYWRAVCEALDQAPTVEIFRRIVAPHPLCLRADELARQRIGAEEPRCHLCPLYAALGGHPQDLGCRSVQDPILESLRAGDREAARERIGQLIRTIEKMPVSDADQREASPGLAAAPGIQRGVEQ